MKFSSTNDLREELTKMKEAVLELEVSAQDMRKDLYRLEMRCGKLANALEATAGEIPAEDDRE